jgi:hypothetical protein
MKNFMLGILVSMSLCSFAITENPDGSVLLSKDEADNTRISFYQLKYNFDLAVSRVDELNKKLEALEKAKCL